MHQAQECRWYVLTRYFCRIVGGSFDSDSKWNAKIYCIFIQSKRFVAEPAIVPSFKVASRPFFVTGCPPSSYVPSSIPVARMASLINIMRSSPNIRKVFRITDGWICMPSQIISAMACGQSVAAPIIPGFR